MGDIFLGSTGPMSPLSCCTICHAKSNVYERGSGIHLNKAFFFFFVRLKIVLSFARISKLISS